MDIMEMKCWNCGKTTMLEEGTVAQALKQMDETKVDFFDVPCPSCQKANRTKKELFTAAYVNRHATAATHKKKKEN